MTLSTTVSTPWTEPCALHPLHIVQIMEWSPWAELRRRPHIRLQFVTLPAATGGGAYRRQGRHAGILIDRRLNQAERRVVLAHELIHDEQPSSTRCEGMPGAWDPVVARDEHRVDVEVARRLVPLEQLDRSARTAEDLGHYLTARDVAEAWSVTVPIATIALELLHDERRARRAS